MLGPPFSFFSPLLFLLVPGKLLIVCCTTSSLLEETPTQNRPQPRSSTSFAVTYSRLHPEIPGREGCSRDTEQCDRPDVFLCRGWVSLIYERLDLFRGTTPRCLLKISFQELV